MKKTMILIAAAVCVAMGGNSCQGKTGGDSGEQGAVSADTTAAVPTFNADSAYQFVKAQCDFGPRVPATAAHKQCAAFLEHKLKEYCDSAFVQHGSVTTFDGKQLTLSNLIGIVNPSAQQRILLLAHWDCRPWADNDPDPANHRKPVMGANDGASGVGVLLEVARTLKQQRPDVGVDIVLVDAEDWGNENDEDSWALGTQYWARHPHFGSLKPAFGILLDMVGATGATFARELFSMQYAGGFVDLVWGEAKNAGFGAQFVDDGGGAVTDDHIPVNKILGIPCIDVIDMRKDSPTGFYDGWHTTHDTIDRIDPATLKAVGQTITNVIYNFTK